MTDLLQQIQQLQTTQRSRAQSLLRDFIKATFPSLDVATVELRPQAISLNSFNGVLTLQDGNRLFFKTHTEQDNVIDEYYNATLLADAGYPIIQPLYSSTSAGQHLLIYELIESPSVFDIAWNIEQEKNSKDQDTLIYAQNNADDELFDIYQNTLSWQTGEEHKQSPIHQLFIHRLLSGRFARFYGNEQQVSLPDQMITVQNLFSKKWNINGQIYEETFQNLVQRISRKTLTLMNQAGNPSVIGHGDAHNGNVFLHRQGDEPAILYFDPAFAGRHHPLLDLAKPLFHNVFAMWMYYPKVQKEKLNIRMESYDDVWVVDYRYPIPEIRRMFLKSKVERTLIPLLQELKRRGWLQDNWREYLKAALFCCPLLTLNLTDTDRFPPEISALGFAMSVEMGAESLGERSVIDQVLDNVEHEI